MFIDDFLYAHPHSRSPNEGIKAFEKQLTLFSHQVNYVCNLEVGGKLTPEEAYTRLQHSWQQLQASRQEAGLD